MPASSGAVSARWPGEFGVWGAKTFLRPLQVFIAAPSLLFLAALTAMLLRHPDVQFYEIDRVAFGLLVVGVAVRAAVTRQMVFVAERATWPMIGLVALAFVSIAGQPFDHETWSLLASKFIVPFALFHLAGLIFTTESRYRQFEIFALVILAYLSFTAIAFLVGARSLIFPRFILDESLGFHKDRARGPLLQAVANGVSLNLLALLVLQGYRRGSVRGIKVLVVLASVPVAIVATMTRAVWLSFAGSVLALIFLSGRRAFWRACLVLVMTCAVGFVILLNCDHYASELGDRLAERGPIDYRQAVYAGGWDMFMDRPWLGWGFHQMPAELPRHVSGYNEKILYPHNTYLELVVEHGLLGLSLYLWLMWEMVKLGRGAIPSGEEDGFLGLSFHRVWPVLLAVYWANAAMVVMSYQFVNGLLFALAGMLAAQRRRAQEGQPC
ncbi:MAG: O-antigen ligase family protein [Candidatus Sulfotelmatobacter sp.]|jgi:O-antigen ligase